MNVEFAFCLGGCVFRQSGIIFCFKMIRYFWIFVKFFATFSSAHLLLVNAIYKRTVDSVSLIVRYTIVLKYLWDFEHSVHPYRQKILGDSPPEFITGVLTPKYDKILMLVQNMA